METDIDTGSTAPTVTVPIVDRESTGREVIRSAVARSVSILLDELPGTRAGDDPEHLHQARVAIRRLRSDLRTFGPLLDPAWARPLRDELSWLADSLGRVRDADVLDLTLDAVTRDVAAIRTDDVLELRAAFDEGRAAARTALMEDLDSGRCAALVAALRDAAADPRTAPQADDPAATTLPSLAAHPWRRIRRAVARLDDPPEDVDLHRIRIHAKRCRYAADAVTPAVGKPARRFSKAMARIQDCLGDLNDAVVITAQLREMSIARPEVAFAAGQTAMVLARRAEHCRADFEGVWRAATASELHAWF